MKVLFLDIDGVLNSAAVLEARGRHDAIDRGMVEQINRVTTETGCSIVISSSWRWLWKLGELKAILRQHGLIDVVIDVTPKDKQDRRRDNEIQTWLAAHPEVTSFAVVDDDTADLTGVQDRLVGTSFMTGILPHHANRLIELLSN